jgi:hypothetical protein
MTKQDVIEILGSNFGLVKRFETAYAIAELINQRLLDISENDKIAYAVEVLRNFILTDIEDLKRDLPVFDDSLCVKLERLLRNLPKLKFDLHYPVSFYNSDSAEAKNVAA